LTVASCVRGSTGPHEHIVALGLAALFLDSEAALPRWFKVRELQDQKIAARYRSMH
jgi:hypothetical protein